MPSLVYGTATIFEVITSSKIVGYPHIMMHNVCKIFGFMVIYIYVYVNVYTYIYIHLSICMHIYIYMRIRI